ncbi:MAG TPA: hypothetical protein VFN16_03960 [Saccharospirillum sp.]|nr:hypothetical protein [Saccharospirillum sp.]
MIRLVVGLLLLLTGTAFAAGNVLLVTDLEEDIPTPLDDNARFSLESGYLLGAIEEKEGVNISLSVKLGLDALF